MTTGNATRDEMILRAIKETVVCHENPQQIGFVADKLPSDFDLSDSELDDALRELKLKDPESLAVPELPAAQVGDAPADDTEGVTITSSPQAVPDDAPEAKLSAEQAQAAVENAHRRLGEARAAVIIARNKLADTKGALALCITAWQTHSDPMTPEQRRQAEVRNHLASEQASAQATPRRRRACNDANGYAEVSGAKHGHGRNGP